MSEGRDERDDAGRDQPPASDSGASADRSDASADSTGSVPPADTDTSESRSEDGPADRDGSDAPDAGPEGDRSLVPLTTTQAVAAVTVVAVLVRLIALGARPMHFDEARVGYWSLHYIDTSSFTYRPIVHGPFIQLVNAFLFSVFGASDFLARLPVAVVGGLLPAAALLYREHLRKSETVALALFLGFNAIFVYYSRYLRSDVLLAAFVFAGFGFLVRYYDTRRVRYLYGAGFFVALGLTTKENALVYLLTWVGATVLLVDHSLFPPRGFRSGVARIRQSWVGRLLGHARTLALVPVRGTDSLEERFDDPRAAGRRVGVFAAHLLGVALLAVAVLVFFYADRGAGFAGVRQPPTPPSGGATGLYEALGQPLQFPGFAYDTLDSALTDALDQWGSVSDGGEDESFLEVYVSTFRTELEAIQNHALAVGVFGLIGFLWERYATASPRNLVTFMSYCALASLFGYSLQSDPGTGYWLTTHIVLPMTVPAAVGAARIYRWGVQFRADGDPVGLFVAVLILVSVAGPAAYTTVQTSYIDTTSEDNGLVQYAQAEADTRDAMTALRAVSDGEGTDAVVYMGEDYTTGYEILGGEAFYYRKPTCLGTGWISSLPLPWYFEAAGSNVSCERDAATLETRIQSDSPPPMIIVKSDDQSVPTDTLAREYDARTFNLYRGAHSVTVHVHEDHVDSAPGWEPPS